MHKSIDSTHNMKKRIRLTESDLHNIIKESVKKVLSEDKNDDVFTSLFINGLNGLNSKNIVKHICDKCNKEERFDDIYPKIIYQYEK